MVLIDLRICLNLACGESCSETLFLKILISCSCVLSFSGFPSTPILLLATVIAIAPKIKITATARAILDRIWIKIKKNHTFHLYSHFSIIIQIYWNATYHVHNGDDSRFIPVSISFNHFESVWIHGSTSNK